MVVIFKLQFPKSCCGLKFMSTFCEMQQNIFDKSTLVSAVKRKAITWTNVGQDLCCHMLSTKSSEKQSNLFSNLSLKKFKLTNTCAKWNMIYKPCQSDSKEDRLKFVTFGIRQTYLLSHHGLVIPYDDIDLGQHWLRWTNGRTERQMALTMIIPFSLEGAEGKNDWWEKAWFHGILSV